MKAGSTRHGARVNAKTGKVTVVRTSRKPKGIAAKLIDAALRKAGK